MKVSIVVTLKKDVLDPQFTSIMKALKGMNFNNVNEVRQRKILENDLDENKPRFVAIGYFFSKNVKSRILVTCKVQISVNI